MVVTLERVVENQVRRREEITGQPRLQSPPPICEAPGTYVLVQEGRT